MFPIVVCLQPYHVKFQVTDEKSHKDPNSEDGDHQWPTDDVAALDEQWYGWFGQSGIVALTWLRS